jgi:hypothetical protein
MRNFDLNASIYMLRIDFVGWENNNEKRVLKVMNKPTMSEEENIKNI